MSRDLDSSTSSKPPSGDILKKSENKQHQSDGDSQAPKRKPGGQPGHPGKTRKGFGRVDRVEILRPEFCHCCGQTDFVGEPIKIETQQVAQLVECPIEIVEYHRHTCVCGECGNLQAADWSGDIVPGQDMGIKRSHSDAVQHYIARCRGTALPCPYGYTSRKRKPLYFNVCRYFNYTALNRML